MFLFSFIPDLLENVNHLLQNITKIIVTILLFEMLTITATNCFNKNMTLYTVYYQESCFYYLREVHKITDQYIISKFIDNIINKNSKKDDKSNFNSCS